MSAGSHPASKVGVARPTFHPLAKLALGLALVALLLWRLDMQAIIAALGRYRSEYLLLAGLLFFLSIPVAALRWKLLAPRFSLWMLTKLSLIGQLYSIVLPGQIAGEVMKAYRLGSGQADAERLATSVLMDKIIGVAALLLLAGCGILDSRHRPPTIVTIAIALLMAGLFGGLFALRIGPLHRLSIRCVRWISRTRLKSLSLPLARSIRAWRDFSLQPGRLLCSLLLGIVFQGLVIGIFMLLGRNIGIDLALSDWAWIAAVTAIAMLLPLSVGGIGLREGSLVGCLGYLGVAGEDAIALSLGVFAITLLGAGAGGLVELFASPRH